MGSISTIGIIGVGQMGSGIAQVAATAGYQTIVWDSRTEVVPQALEGIGKNLERMAKKGRIEPDLAEGAKTRLQAAKTLEDFGQCDLVIEAIVENTDAKLELLAKLDEILPPSAFLVSNTSSISITKLAAGTKRPEKVMGVHFMNPVPVMKLVELIKGLQTSDETYQAMLEVCQKMEKETVLGVDSPGFVVNRILCPMVNEAMYLVEQGVKPEDVDKAMKLGANHPMGPLKLADFVGLDTLLAIMRVLHQEIGEDKYRPCPLLVKYVEAGWYGKKAGRGFYTWE